MGDVIALRPDEHEPQYLSEIKRGLKQPSSEILGAVAGALGLRLAA